MSSSRWFLALAVCAHFSVFAEPSDLTEQFDALPPSLQQSVPTAAEVSVPTSTQPELSSAWFPQLKQAGQSVGAHTNLLISTAMELVGVPYRRGGTNASSGFDCSGFVRNVYAQALGHELPRIARDQAKVTTKIQKNELQPGDLVFFNTMRRAFSHVGIYVGDGQFIHAPRPGASIRIEHMSTSYWSKRFNGARRVSVAEDARTTAVESSALSSLVEHSLPAATYTLLP